MDIITREGPSQAGDGSSQHTLHGLLGDGHSILGFLDSHGGRSGDITNHNGRSHTPGTVALNPGVGGEGVAVQALTKVLHHVVTLRLTVNIDVEVKLLLDLNNILNLLLNKLLILLGGDLALGKFVTLDTNLLGLGEGTNGSGWEQRKVEVLLLLGDTDWELRDSVVHGRGDLGLALLDLGVIGSGGTGTGLHRLGVGLELLTDGGWAISDSFGNHSNLGSLLNCEREPVGDLRVEVLLAGEGVGGVKEGAGGSNNNTILAKLLDGSLNSLNSPLEVCLPNVTAINDTSRQNCLWAERRNDSIKLLWVADEINVDGIDVSWESINVMDDVTKVSREDNLGDLSTQASQFRVSWLEGSLGLGGQIKDKDGLVNLDGLCTSVFEFGKKLLVDGQKLVQEVNWIDSLATIRLAEVEEGHRADEDRSSGNASLLGFEELGNRLGGRVELEGLVVLESRLNIVVVRIEPLHHLQTGDINAILLVATAHGKVFIDPVEASLCVSLGGSLFQACQQGISEAAHFRELTPKS